MILKEVSWSDRMPLEVRRPLIPILRKWIILVPAWCRDFRTSFDPNNSDTFAQMTSNYVNRWACLCVTPRWLTESQDEREAIIIHELIHTNLEPLDQVVDRMLGALPNDEIRSLSRAFCKDGLEAATEDLAWAFLRIAKKGGA